MNTKIIFILLFFSMTSLLSCNELKDGTDPPPKLMDVIIVYHDNPEAKTVEELWLEINDSSMINDSPVYTFDTDINIKCHPEELTKNDKLNVSSQLYENPSILYIRWNGVWDIMFDRKGLKESEERVFNVQIKYPKGYSDKRTEDNLVFTWSVKTYANHQFVSALYNGKEVMFYLMQRDIPVLLLPSI